MNVGGTPDRGASASRSQTERLLSACRHRLRHYRTLLGQTPSSRALTRTPTPSTACSMTRARSANCWGVEWVRTSCSSSSRCSSLSSCPTAVHCARSRARSARACASGVCSNHPLDPTSKGKHHPNDPQRRAARWPTSDRNPGRLRSELVAGFVGIRIYVHASTSPQYDLGPYLRLSTVLFRSAGVWYVPGACGAILRR